MASPPSSNFDQRLDRLEESLELVDAMNSKVNRLIAPSSTSSPMVLSPQPLKPKASNPTVDNLSPRSYQFAVPMPISLVHPSRQPYPFFENKNHGESIEMNGRKLKSHVFQVILATARKGISFLENGIVIILSPRIESPPSKFNGFAQGLRDMDYFNGHEVLLSTNTTHPHFEKLSAYRLIQLGHVWAEIKEWVRMTLQSVKKRCYSTMDDFIFRCFRFVLEDKDHFKRGGMLQVFPN